MYAVVETSGHQYRVEEGATLRLDRMGGEVGQEVAFDRVLLVKGDNEAQIGTPTVANAKVVGTIVRHTKGAKIIALKFKRRKGYHRKVGFRAQYTDIRIERIEV